MTVRYSPAVEVRIEDATRTLTHYLHGSANENDEMRAEIRYVIERILGAAVIQVQEDMERATAARLGIGVPR